MRILPIDPLDRVTGSCYLIHVPERDVRLLVDCGAYQDGLDADVLDDRPFPFDPSRIAAVLLTHAHYDHCGRLPRLILQGFQGSVIATEETIAIAKIVLEDSVKLRGRLDERAALDRIRWRPYGTHLFARPLSVATDVFVLAHRSAHIFGAVSVEVIVGPKEDPSTQVRVLFSGDIGNNQDGREVQPFLRHIMHPSKTVDVAVMESTYGATRRKPEAFDAVARRERLRFLVRDGLARGGPVVIPVFGIQRAQDLLWDLHLLNASDNEFLGDAPILMDAPMGLAMHSVVCDAMGRDSVSPTGKARPVWLGRHLMMDLELDSESPEDLHKARAAIRRVFGERPEWWTGQRVEPQDSGGAYVDRVRAQWWRVPSWARDSVVAEQRPCVVLATGGMADGGPVQTWLRAWLTDARATVAFPGYCSKTTLGFEIAQLAGMDAQERLRLQEPLSLPECEIRRCDIAASIHVLSGYSAHADQSGLVDWVFPRMKDGTVFPVARRVLITHGDAGSRRVLRDAVLDRAAAAGFPLQVDLPRPDGHGLDVRTGAPVPREWVLGTAIEGTGEDISLAEAIREVRELRAENARLRAKLAKLELTKPDDTKSSRPSGPSQLT